MLDKYLKTTTINKRKGVITSVEIPSNTPICEFTGTIFLEKDLSTLIEPENTLQISSNLYLGPSGSFTDHIRHSCSPNCLIHASGKRAILYSLYLIKPGSELTFDYSTTSTDSLDSWKMKCTCGSYTCRKIISGFYELDIELQKKYKEQEIAALFIRNPIFMKK